MGSRLKSHKNASGCRGIAYTAIREWLKKANIPVVLMVEFTGCLVHNLWRTVSMKWYLFLYLRLTPKIPALELAEGIPFLKLPTSICSPHSSPTMEKKSDERDWLIMPAFDASIRNYAIFNSFYFIFHIMKESVCSLLIIFIILSLIWLQLKSNKNA